MLGKPNVKLHSDEKEKIKVIEAVNIWTLNDNPDKEESYIIS